MIREQNIDDGVEFVYTRVFNAPRELVFDTFTQTEHMQQWWGPKGCKIEVKTHDLRPGGMFHYSMRNGDGPAMWGRIVYREIVRPERLVLVNSFSDEQCGVTRHPAAPDWPLEMLNTSTFDDEGGKTRLTLRSRPLNANATEVAFFKAGHASMQGGFGGMYDVYEQYLADYLAKR
ncbi:MAG: SRPBCC domain-containing protein [Pseudomonadota bacterium]